MPRILIDGRALADPNAGGVGRAARLWIKKMASQATSRTSQVRGDEATRDEFVCVTTGLAPSPSVKKFCDGLGIGYLHLRFPNKLWTLGCWLKIFSLDRAAARRVGRIDRVLLPNLGFVGRLKSPYELLLHDVSFAIEPRWFKWRMRLWHALLPVRQLITLAEKLHSVSERTKCDTVKLFGADPDKFTIFRFDAALPSVPSMRPGWLPQTANRYVLLMGGSDPRKNTETAISAITRFNLGQPNNRVVPIVLGQKSQKHCHKTGPCIRPQNHVSDPELGYLYENASVFLYPSWYEGYGLPLHEAKFHHVACISSTAGALPETAPRDTIFCHPAKPHEWLAALELVLGPSTPGIRD